MLFFCYAVSCEWREFIADTDMQSLMCNVLTSQGLAVVHRAHTHTRMKMEFMLWANHSMGNKQLHSVSRHACSLSFYNDFNLFIVGAIVFYSSETILNQLKYVKYVEQLIFEPAGAPFISPTPAFHQPLRFIFFSFHSSQFHSNHTSMAIESVLHFIEHNFSVL